jgi:hypothetical protein
VVRRRITSRNADSDFAVGHARYRSNRHESPLGHYIEAINLIDGGLLTRVQKGDLYIRGTQNTDVTQFGVTLTPNVSSTRVNTTVQNLAVTTKTVVYARGGNDVVTQGTLPVRAEFYGEAGDWPATSLTTS